MENGLFVGDRVLQKKKRNTSSLIHHNIFFFSLFKKIQYKYVINWMAQHMYAWTCPNAFYFSSDILTCSDPYLSNANCCNVLTVWSCSQSSAKRSCQKSTDSLHSNSTIDGVLWWGQCPCYSSACVIVTHRFNNWGEHPSKYPKHPCDTNSGRTPLTWINKEFR